MKIMFADAGGAWEEFSKNVCDEIIHHGWKLIGDIGGGANPLLSQDFIHSHRLQYDLIDISEDELAKAAPGYRKVILDLEQPVAEGEVYDFVFAQMTLEHIRDPRIFHANVLRLLKPGGAALFFFACGSSLPSLTNRFLPESLSGRILLRLQPFRSNEKHGKFKAYYRWCAGPSRRNIGRFRSAGYAIGYYIGYFGHSYYQKIPFLQKLEKIKTKCLLRHPHPRLCSYASVLVRKGANSRDGNI